MRVPSPGQALPTLCSFVMLALAAPATQAAPTVISGASFDAPANCQTLDSTLVCKVDEQQLELWITRKPLELTGDAATAFMRRMARLNEIHDAAVSGIMRSTGNDNATAFTGYGSLAAIGTLVNSKVAAPGKPVVRIASLLHDDEAWQILEASATRTPAVEALSAALQRSLKLPPAKAANPVAASGPVAASTVQPDIPVPAAAPKVEIAPGAALLNTTLLTLQYPLYLQPEVVENTVETVVVKFRRRTHAGGPNLTITLRPSKATDNVAAIASTSKAATSAAMLGKPASVEVNRLGTLAGSGYALVGTPDAKRGFSGVESLETFFATIVNGRILEVQMSAEQAHASDAQSTWALLGNSLSVASTAAR